MQATVLAKGLSVLLRMTTIYASKGTPLKGVQNYRRDRKKMDRNQFRRRQIQIDQSDCVKLGFYFASACFHPPKNGVFDRRCGKLPRGETRSVATTSSSQYPMLLR